MTERIAGRYTVLKKLGEGGMGAVYLAQDERLDREVAIKRLQVIGASEDSYRQFLARFEREAKAMARLQHPGIVRIYDYGSDASGAYLVLEYLPNGSLKERMTRVMPVSQAIQILKPVAEALDYLHRRGMIHRDIKPANILFDENDNPMLADFGIIKLLEGAEGMTLTGTGVTVGTPAYMSPELISGEATPSSDQYALAVVLYEMVTGKKPFEGRTPMETLTQHKYEPLPDPRRFKEDLPSDTCAVLQKSLAKDPAQRYASMQDFARALEAGGVRADQAQAVLDEMETMLVAKPAVPAMGEVPAPVVRMAEAVTVLPQTDAVNSPMPHAAAAGTPKPQTDALPVKKPKRTGRKILIGCGGLLALLVVILAIVSPGLLLYPFARLIENSFYQRTERKYEKAEASPLAEAPGLCGSIGEEWTNPVNGMTAVCVPAGDFIMGSDTGEEDARPAHEVYLDAYWIDRLEVTNQQYQDCVAAGVCVKPTLNDQQGLDGNDYKKVNYYADEIYQQHPVVNLNWYQAAMYCHWTGGRLPTEAEWEKAARGTDERLYPWGNDFQNCVYANHSVTNDGEGYFTPCLAGSPATNVVGSYLNGASPYGVLDMAGNAAEWVTDWYDESYYGRSPRENPLGPLAAPENAYNIRITRGGNSFADIHYLQTSDRDESPLDGKWHTGIRCVYEP